MPFDQLACEMGQWRAMERAGDRQKKVFVPK